MNVSDTVLIVSPRTNVRAFDITPYFCILIMWVQKIIFWTNGENQMTYAIKTANGWRPWMPLNVPCPNSNQLEGVYRPEPIEQVQASLQGRMSRWIKAMETGDTRAFRGHSFVEPITGAFGEKL